MCISTTTATTEYDKESGDVRPGFYFPLRDKIPFSIPDPPFMHPHSETGRFFTIFGYISKDPRSLTPQSPVETRSRPITVAHGHFSSSSSAYLVPAICPGFFLYANIVPSSIPLSALRAAASETRIIFDVDGYVAEGLGDAINWRDTRPGGI